MILYDTFLFSEPHESNLLYLKFVLGDSLVDKWIIQENHYTLQGEPKDVHAQKIIESEERFAPYRNKVLYATANNPIVNGKDENHNFLREKVQRTFCLDLTLQFENPSTYFIVSDVDEMFDFTDENRKQRFIETCNNCVDFTFWIQRMRYWYDYDNRCYLDDIHIPVVPVRALSKDTLAMCRHYKDYDRCFGGLENPIAFEYSYVFKTIEDLYRKKQTYAHTGFTLESLEEGLKLNAWPRPKERGERRGPHDFFETVELTPENSPLYVRENLETLKTNTVDKSYKENRARIL